MSTPTLYRLPAWPFRSCGCGMPLVGRRTVCDDCKKARNRENTRVAMQAKRGTVRPRDLAQLPPFSKYTLAGLFRCQAVNRLGQQCQHPRPHGSAFCVAHRGTR